MTAGYARGFLIASMVALAGGLLALLIPRQVSAPTAVAAEVAAAVEADPEMPAIEL